MHEVLVNRLGGLRVGRKSLPRKSVVRLTDRPDMTLDVYRGRKTTIQYNIGTYICQAAHMRRLIRTYLVRIFSRKGFVCLVQNETFLFLIPER